MAESLITGAAGHIGFALVKELINRGEKPRLLLRRDVPAFKDMNVEIVMGDITKPDTLAKACEGVDVVYHLAGLVEIGDSNSNAVWSVNVDGTQNVVTACKNAGVKRLVYASSVDAMPPAKAGTTMTEPSSFSCAELNGAYARSKAVASQAVLNAANDDFEVVICMPSACVGPYDYKISSVGVMVRWTMHHTMPVTLKFGGYNFVDVRDVAYGLAESATKGRSGECYLLTGEYCTSGDIFKMLSELNGRRVPTFSIATGFVDFAAPLAEGYYKVSRSTPLFTRYTLRKLRENGLFNHDKATRDLGYNPRSPRESLRDMIQWIMENEKQAKG